MHCHESQGSLSRQLHGTSDKGRKKRRTLKAAPSTRDTDAHKNTQGGTIRERWKKAPSSKTSDINGPCALSIFTSLSLFKVSLHCPRVSTGLTRFSICRPSETFFHLRMAFHSPSFPLIKAVALLRSLSFSHLSHPFTLYSTSIVPWEQRLAVPRFLPRLFFSHGSHTVVVCLR